MVGLVVLNLIKEARNVAGRGRRKCGAESSQDSCKLRLDQLLPKRSLPAPLQEGFRVWV